MQDSVYQYTKVYLVQIKLLERKFDECKDLDYKNGIRVQPGERLAKSGS